MTGVESPETGWVPIGNEDSCKRKSVSGPVLRLFLRAERKKSREERRGSVWMCWD